ncbi:MAG TPA: PadR family transcriptional regulator [Spirochaetia bacterium]|nr:PadR family transcriptional regulator [Spirochaetia bacterium]
MRKENTTKYAVLGLLRVRPCSGYDLKKFSDMSLAHFWSENYGHIYPVLKQLKASKSVASEERQTPGRPPKSVYRITEKGIRELEQWLGKPAERHPYRNEMLLKMFLSRDGSAPHLKDKVRAAREQSAVSLATFKAIEERLKTSEPERSQPSLPLWLATLDFGKRTTQAEIEWCDATLRMLEKLPAERKEAGR